MQPTGFSDRLLNEAVMMTASLGNSRVLAGNQSELKLKQMRIWIVIGIVLVIAAAVCIPNFVGNGRRKNATYQVLAIAKIGNAAKSAAAHTGGVYPLHLNDLLPYLPSDRNQISGFPEGSDVVELSLADFKTLRSTGVTPALARKWNLPKNRQWIGYASDGNGYTVISVINGSFWIETDGNVVLHSNM